jgi:nucleotide-binding universal stress UspA family protein
VSTIVVGYVPKPEGRAALDEAIEEARRRKSRLIVVNSHRGGRDFDRDDAEEARAKLLEVEEQLQQSGVEHDIRPLVRGQDPADDLIAVAEEEGAELIVIGLRRRTPIGKLILGSNAQRVLLDSSCPVLAVKSEA